MFDFDFFGTDYLKGQTDLLTEALEIKASNMTKARFESFLKKTFLKTSDKMFYLKGEEGQEGKYTYKYKDFPALDILDVSLPSKPKREMNAFTRTELQSFRVKVKCSHNIRLDFLVQFESTIKGARLSASTRGFISEVKINNQPIRLSRSEMDTEKAATSSVLKAVITKVRNGLKAAYDELGHKSAKQAKRSEKEDSIKSKKENEHTGQTLEQEKKRKKHAASQSEEEREGRQKKRAKSIKKQHEAVKAEKQELQKKLEQRRREVESIGSSGDGLQSQIDQMQEYKARLQQQLESLRSTQAA
jgi:hypothetical protein